jgi:hypothetical protein
LPLPIAPNPSTVRGSGGCHAQTRLCSLLALRVCETP